MPSSRCSPAKCKPPPGPPNTHSTCQRCVQPLPSPLPLLCPSSARASPVIMETAPILQEPMNPAQSPNCSSDSSSEEAAGQSGHSWVSTVYSALGEPPSLPPLPPAPRKCLFCLKLCCIPSQKADLHARAVPPLFLSEVPAVPCVRLRLTAR